MDLFKDALSGNVVAVAVAGAAAVTLPILVPSLAPALAPKLRTALKLGVSLFLESQSEAEAELVQQLVQHTMEGLLSVLSGPGSDAHRRNAAAARIRHFEARARRRARRFGSDERDAAGRYQRQVGSLKRALSHAKRRHPSVEPALEHVSGLINEDW